MIYAPAIPLSGVGGWSFLQRTEARQFETFRSVGENKRDIDYFRENIANAKTAEDLVADRRLRTIALGAFGLQDDINKQAFIERVLEEGSEDETSFANRLVDPKYAQLAQAFGYGNLFGTRVHLSDFAEEIIAKFEVEQFEVAVGDVDVDLRLAMNFRRNIADIAAASTEEEPGWLTVMGSEPLRQVMDAALGLPAGLAGVDLDRQVAIYEDRARRQFGEATAAAFLDPENVERAINRFLVQREIANGPGASTPGFSALSLLQNSGLGGGAAQNLLISQF